MPTWTRTVSGPRVPSPAEFAKVTTSTLGKIGRAGVKQIQQVIWPMSRFKRPTGRSTKAWGYAAKSEATGLHSLTFFNTATNKYGVNYPKYVHLAGRPKSELLWFEVIKYSSDTIGPAAGLAVAQAYADLRATMPVQKTVTKAG